jgi:hypothetical protein
MIRPLSASGRKGLQVLKIARIYLKFVTGRTARANID